MFRARPGPAAVLIFAACGVALIRATPMRASQPISASQLWLAPASPPDQPSELATAVAALESGGAADALPVFVRWASDPVLGGYARLYEGRADMALGRADDALPLARTLAAGSSGYLHEAALWLVATAAEASDSWADAVGTYQALIALNPAHLPEAYLGLARAAEKARDIPSATTAYRKVYYEFPLTDEATEAAAALERLPALSRAEKFARDLARAEALFTGRRYADARKAYDALRTGATSDDQSRLALRIAECDVSLRHYPQARTELATYISRSKFRVVEARFFYLSAIRGLGRENEYVSRVDEFVAANPKDPLAESALNDLGTYYILNDEDDKAASVFADMFSRFPRGAYAERAAWKSGWWAFKSGNYAETVRVFDLAVASFPHSDYRPIWLYWSARASDLRRNVDAARTGYSRVVTDYRNSYYGREAVARLSALDGGRPSVSNPPLAVVSGSAPPSTPLIKALLSAGLYDDAVAEVRDVESRAGTSPMLEATIAYAFNRKGELRPAITAMRRAYPQFMADGGDALPRSILSVIFPLDYWTLIKQYAAEHALDPYVMAALIAQESTFQADVRSAANAWGLMQVEPATGRRYAPRLDIRSFATSRLTDPETNIRIGMAYFADLMTEFHDVAAALAAYNAGENRVEAWLSERPGVPRDQFIDDIPFPETQNYVKRVIGTAENYRDLYGTTPAP